MSTVFYADDVVLVSDSIDKMQELLRRTEKFGLKYEIKYNGDKTNLITFSKHKYIPKIDRNKKLTLIGIEIILRTYSR